MKESVLICSECRKKWLQTGWLKRQGWMYRLTVLDAASSRAGFQQAWFHLRPVFMACRQRPSQGALTGLSPCVRVRISSSQKGTSHTGSGPPYQPHCNLIGSLKALSPNSVTFWVPGVKASVYEIWGCNSVIKREVSCSDRDVNEVRYPSWVTGWACCCCCC